MRIVHTESSAGWGGQEIRILNEMAGMIARGHELHLLCPPGARIFGEAARRGIPATALPVEKKRLRGVLALRAWLKAHAVDVINTHSSTDSWLAALACATLPAAPPLVRTRHISAPVPDNAATRWLYARATRRIVTTGEMIRAQLVRDNGFDAARIVSVPTGIDLTLFRPLEDEQGQGEPKQGEPKQGEPKRALRARLGLPVQAHVVGIVATLRSWKGHRFLIEAFAQAAARDAHLLIVGDGPQREALTALVAELGLGARVTLAGNQTDVVPWLQAIDVFALPSYANEGVPQAILQAFACGLPVVTTAAGAIGEIARDGDTALVVPMQDATALAHALDRLHDDAPLAHALAARALALVRAAHGIDGMLDRMEAVFRAALAGAAR